VLNFSSNDFLGFSQNERLKEISRETLRKYGCGSCGPRGFYGTIDKHLEFEKEIADFMGTPASPINIFLFFHHSYFKFIIAL